MPHPADTNDGDNVLHARHLEPEASHYEGTHIHVYSACLSVNHGLEELQKPLMVK